MRIRKATTILTVALTASACGGATEATAPVQHELAGNAQAPSPTAGGGDRARGATTATDRTAPPTEAAPPQPTPNAPSSGAACELDSLNEELSNTQHESALEEHRTFRCLCDDQGYPLVGNINGKGTTASKFCSAIKEKGLL